MRQAVNEVLTPKAQQTREHIAKTALELFEKKGYQETTMRDIASEAGISLGLTYRYFAQKEDLVLNMYENCARELEEEATQLPSGKMANRFAQVLRSDFRRLIPFRGAFGALFSVGLSPESEMAVLGEGASKVRSYAWRTFHSVINGSTDRPNDKQAEHLATLFYALHLLLILFWMQDRSEGQQKTEELVKFTEETVGLLRPLLLIPQFSRSMERLVDIIAPMFGPKG